ncbi:MAG: hypothetical protein K8W52_08295 [Deltaproteobacteria bacterium]|nr:hypothetical protein [Deltaproteobacteria bacterium]
MRIVDILATHDAYRGFTTVPGNLGDGYLYCANPIFRAVRDRASAAGVEFTTEDFCAYGVASLAALGPILRARKVPYQDNVGVLRRAEDRRPGGALRNVMPVKANLLMHEAAHCVADQRLPATLGVRGLSAARAIALRAALGESLANTSELLGAVAADTAVHRYFYDQNSFSRVEARGQEALRATIELVGWTATARVVFLSFVLANTLSKTIDDLTCRRLWALAGVTAPRRRGERAALERVTRAGLGLNLRFRIETAAFFLRYEHGIEDDVFRLNAYDVLAVLERDPALRRTAFGLCDVLTEAA